eukprot:TRINITY_DN10516_c0_g1_i1.p1 TRINITY_DN10516_c0_g1~~TRINITY_DN10516_c0_g1_i1.p1  ORF type:complete len:506 (+),score=96.21 TRINITY_DN10516_c0_g1_i1:125-1519(+)
MRAETPEECQKHCQASHLCFRWTWHEGSCSLKRDMLKRAPDTFWPMAPNFPTQPVPVKGAVSGPKNCLNQARWDKAAMLKEINDLHTCSFSGYNEVQTILKRCVRKSAFAHWQVSHSTSTHGKTYPRKEWEHCSSERRTCRCYTKARYGHDGNWAYLDLDESIEGVMCTAKHFPTLNLDRGRAKPRRCECYTSETEQEASATSTYLGISMQREEPFGVCDVPLRLFSKKFDELSWGWGETAIHIVLGLTAHCFKELPQWVSVGSWKQDAKGYRLPCSSLTGFPFYNYNDEANYGVVYSQRINHWRWMPMNISSDARAAIKEVFGLDAPAELPGGPRGNPDIQNWDMFAWTHACCQYMVMTTDAQASFARFFTLVTMTLAENSSASASAAYCFLWKSDGCIPRWYGYIGEALFILWSYYTQRLVPLVPGSTTLQCESNMVSEHKLYGELTHKAIDEAFTRWVGRH